MVNGISVLFKYYISVSNNPPEVVEESSGGLCKELWLCSADMNIMAVDQLMN